MVRLKSKKLNLGCGKDYRERWIKVEVFGPFKKDISSNLNKLPYLSGGDSFEEVLMNMILEHLTKNRKDSSLLKEH